MARQRVQFPIITEHFVSAPRPLNNWGSYTSQFTRLVDNNVDADGPIPKAPKIEEENYYSSYHGDHHGDPYHHGGGQVN